MVLRLKSGLRPARHLRCPEIYTSEPNDQQDPIYNLNGQRVTRPGNGIYIMGGKKFKLIKF